MYSSCNFGRMLSVDGFCASKKKGGIGRGGRVSARGAVYMAVALAGCKKAVHLLRKALVSTGLGISNTNGHR